MDVREKYICALTFESGTYTYDPMGEPLLFDPQAPPDNLGRCAQITLLERGTQAVVVDTTIPEGGKPVVHTYMITQVGTGIGYRVFRVGYLLAGVKEMTVVDSQGFKNKVKEKVA